MAKKDKKSSTPKAPSAPVVPAAPATPPVSGAVPPLVAYLVAIVAVAGGLKVLLDDGTGLVILLAAGIVTLVWVVGRLSPSIPAADRPLLRLLPFVAIALTLLAVWCALALASGGKPEDRFKDCMGAAPAPPPLAAKATRHHTVGRRRAPERERVAAKSSTLVVASPSSDGGVAKAAVPKVKAIKIPEGKRREKRSSSHDRSEPPAFEVQTPNAGTSPTPQTSTTTPASPTSTSTVPQPTASAPATVAQPAAPGDSAAVTETTSNPSVEVDVDAEADGVEAPPTTPDEDGQPDDGVVPGS